MRFKDVLDLLGAGPSHEDVLEELPDLKAEDIAAAILYSRHQLERY